jgi:hypothetical protein
VEVIIVQPPSIIIQVEPEPVPLPQVVQVEPEPVPLPLIVLVEPAPLPQVVLVEPEPIPASQVEPKLVSVPQVVQVDPEPIPAPQAIQSAPEPASPQPEVLTSSYYVTQEQFESTKIDIQQLVQELNAIIRKGDFNTWLTYLGDEYRLMISSREFRNELVGKYPAFQGRINTARDYFTYVVVPSRANDHVDDIEYFSENEVKAYTEDTRGYRVVLYSLEYRDGKWKIVN